MNGTSQDDVQLSHGAASDMQGSKADRTWPSTVSKRAA